MLNLENSILVLVDIQGKLAELMHERETLYANLVRLTNAAKLLDLPILWVEQIPEKLGATIPQLSELLPDNSPIRKTSFSCCGEPGFISALVESGRDQIILTGIECHVCVFQTAADLLEKEYAVHLVADAVSSRTLANKQVGINRMDNLGAEITSTEMVLFELMRNANHPKFREVSKYIK